MDKIDSNYYAEQIKQYNENAAIIDENIKNAHNLAVVNMLEKKKAELEDDIEYFEFLRDRQLRSEELDRKKLIKNAAKESISKAANTTEKQADPIIEQSNLTPEQKRRMWNSPVISAETTRKIREACGFVSYSKSKNKNRNRYR